MNGQPWTRAEIDELCRTVTRGGNTLALGLKLGRTHEALMAKAKRLQIAFDPAEAARHAAAVVVTLVPPSPPPAAGFPDSDFAQRVMHSGLLRP